MQLKKSSVMNSILSNAPSVEEDERRAGFGERIFRLYFSTDMDDIGENRSPDCSLLKVLPEPLVSIVLTFFRRYSVKFIFRSLCEDHRFCEDRGGIVYPPSLRSLRGLPMAKRELSAEQASLLTIQEYEHLKRTYTSLVESISLTEHNHIALESREGEHYTLKVTADGWRVVDGGTQNDRERTWEMVEDLLRSVSDTFKQGWDGMLLTKLSALADQQLLRRSSEDTNQADD
jgi:hypothetical protein